MPSAVSLDMETLLHTPEIREADVAALLVQDQPYSRIQK